MFLFCSYFTAQLHHYVNLGDYTKLSWERVIAQLVILVYCNFLWSSYYWWLFNRLFVTEPLTWSILSVPVLLQIHFFHMNWFVVLGMLHNFFHTLHVGGKSFLYALKWSLSVCEGILRNLMAMLSTNGQIIDHPMEMLNNLKCIFLKI